MELLSELVEDSELNSVPNRLHGVKVKVEIMHRVEGGSGDFARHI
jgi:hypothetical protein